MQKLFLIALCLLPLSLFAQNEKTFEEVYGMSWEEMVERYSVQTTTTVNASMKPMDLNSTCTMKTASPQEELAALRRQKDNIEGNIKHLSLNIDTADPVLLEKYKKALIIKSKRIALLEKELGKEPDPKKIPSSK
ncbi:MAG: hypothetical protein GY810_26435 [Aureispira sp.]|nr:hypothetical protein [Aureispira sp.]